MSSKRLMNEQERWTFPILDFVEPPLVPFGSSVTVALDTFLHRWLAPSATARAWESTKDASGCLSQPRTNPDKSRTSPTGTGYPCPDDLSCPDHHPNIFWLSTMVRLAGGQDSDRPSDSFISHTMDDNVRLDPGWSLRVFPPASVRSNKAIVPPTEPNIEYRGCSFRLLLS